MNKILKHSHLAATLGSIALLLGAFGFQEILGFEPCTLCIWQRWPHAIIPFVFIMTLVFPNLIWYVGGTLIMFLSVGLAGFHVGVEQDWWEGLSSCSSTQGLVTEGAVLDFSQDLSVVMCDEIVWSFLNLSMAGWNAVFSLLLTGLWILSLRYNYRNNHQ